MVIPLAVSLNGANKAPKKNTIKLSRRVNLCIGQIYINVWVVTSYFLIQKSNIYVFNVVASYPEVKHIGAKHWGEPIYTAERFHY